MTPNPKNFHRCNGGWRVRLKRNLITYEKFFCDSAYGNPANSYNAAVEFRNNIVSSNPINIKHIHKTKRSKTGIIGVYKTNNAYVATWYDNGIRKSQSFSISKHKENAILMAIHAASNKSPVNTITWKKS